MSTEAAWLAGLREAARGRLDPEVDCYVAQGSRDGLSLLEAGPAWRSFRLRPHVLRDVSHVDLAVDLLGRRSAVPWGVAPTTLQRAVHPEGEIAVARACAQDGTVMVVSSNAGSSFAEIGATGVRWWLQAYLPNRRLLAEPMLARAVAAGAEAVVLTVDTAVVATRYGPGRAEVEARHPGLVGTNLDPGLRDGAEGAPVGSEKARDLGPGDIGWLRAVTGLPVVVKGVLRADDARRCVEGGAAAVWVSNHGGRQLDRVVATADALPSVVEAIGGSAQVYVDGGVRDGLDVLTALALGADAVFVGRPVLWALVDGEAGVRRLARELRTQTVEALRLAGCSTPWEAKGLAEAVWPGSRRSDLASPPESPNVP